MTRTTRPISWVNAALKEFGKFPEEAQAICLSALTIAADGGKADIAKPMKGLGSGVIEIALPYRGNAFRVVYAVQLGENLWVVHAFQKKIDARRQDASARDRFDTGPPETIEGDVEMKKEEFEVIRGSGNAFRDLGKENADIEQFKAILAAEIIKALDRDGLSVRKAHSLTGIAAADFSRVRNADLGRFTVDRLMRIINRLGSRVDVAVKVRRGRVAHQAVTT